MEEQLQDGVLMNKKDIREFFDRLAPRWDEDLVVDQAKINGILDCGEVKPGARVLDVACGTGVLFPFYRERQVSHVLAVDLSPEMAKIATARAGGQIRVVCGDIEGMEGTGDYDCCMVYNAFPHFPDPAGVIRCLAGWLKAGGHLTVAHSMSVEQLNRHHAGAAAKVSRGAMSAEELAALFSRWFSVDTAISDEEKYIVSGTLLRKGEDI
ncbi:MAG: class I SAM-dependent methyltransferase [Roseburia sp.]|nr:class I SAM-dependent methyltransferase [Roseburia sp.]MCM1097930.1 class I SAM-dependent methyltransferase [Ruminococcus flavefaciens]